MSQRQAIEDFLTAGNSLLNLQASSSEEIGRAGQEARRLVTQLGDVSQVWLAWLLCGDHTPASWGRVSQDKAFYGLAVLADCWSLRSGVFRHISDAPCSCTQVRLWYACQIT